MQACCYVKDTIYNEIVSVVAVFNDVTSSVPVFLCIAVPFIPQIFVQ